MKRWLKRLWELRFFFPLTPLGALVLGLSLFTRYVYAAQEADFVLHAASLVALGLVASSLSMVLIVSGLLWLRLRRGEEERDTPLSLESKATTGTGFSVPAYRAWPLVQVEPSWAAPRGVKVKLEPIRDARAGRRWQEVVTPSCRGEHESIVRRFLVGDIFGMIRLGLLRRVERAVRILPSRAKVDSRSITHITGGDALSHPAGPAEGELLDMRRYAHGDPLRRVLWRAFARTRQLLVRMPERAISPSPSTVSYFVAGGGDEATASTARYFIEEGLLGQDFLFCADGSSLPTADSEEALEQLVRSVSARGEGGQGLARFVEGLESHRRERCLLFVPSRSGRWLPRVEAVARRLPSAVVVLGLDDLILPRRRVLSRLLFFRDDAERRVARGLRPLLTRLTAAGYEVQVVHRPSGRVLPPAQLEVLAR